MSVMSQVVGIFCGIMILYFLNKLFGYSIFKKKTNEVEAQT